VKGFIDRITKSISGKLIATIGLLFLLGCGISWYALISSERNTLMGNAIDYTASYADLIQRSVHHSMLSVHREAIQRAIENIGAQKNIRMIRILDNRGRIFFSSRPAEINKTVTGRPAWGGANPRGLPGATAQWKIDTEGTGKKFLVYYAPIYNEPACFSAACHVHSKDEKVVGTLQTDFSLQGVNRIIRNQAARTTVFAVVFLCVTSVIMFFFVWRFVHNPVSLLARNMRRIASGDLRQRVPLTGEDEISQLAGTFNKMAEDLEKTTVSRDLLIAEIEERKKIEEKLQQSEQFVNTAFDSIHDPFVIVGRDFRITRTNEGYALMRNVPLKDLIGAKCHEILYQNNDICEDCTVSRTFLSGDPCASDRCILRDGIETWYQIYTYPILSSDGGVSHVIEYYRDITDRKKAESATKAAHAELDQIFNTAADGMCVIDRNFELQRVNRTFLEMFSMHGKTVIGRKCYEILPGPECHTARCPLTLISGGQEALLEFESEKLPTDRDRFPCLVFATAFNGQNGELPGIVENIKDITERKRMEDELRNMSLTDELTGLYNRRGFYALVEQELKMANRNKKGIYLLYADLDGFKKINDTLGHKEGDKVLQNTARIFRATFRSSDIVARLGGDEFVVVPIGTKGDHVDKVIARLQGKIDLHNQGENLKYKLSMSVGVTYYDPEAPTSIDELLASADKCMYDNKKSRRSS
jgi:diguanylate cyclase (GGDEF)-like protein/PAS domain S-box-containing protein